MPNKRKDTGSPNRSTTAKLERIFFSLLTDNNIVFTPHPRKIASNPNCLIKPDVLVFVDSDFWHGWHFKQWRSSVPRDDWVEKIEVNIRRDYQNLRALRSEGYTVLRIWEHSLINEPQRVIAMLRDALEK